MIRFPKDQGKRGYYVLFTLGIFLAIAATVVPVQGPGIQNPQPFAAYLNGTFPTSAPRGADNNFTVENAYPNLTFNDPMALLKIPNEDSFYVAGKPGYLWKISSTNSSTTVKRQVLDITGLIDTDGDAGLNGVVLHPEFGDPTSPNRNYIYTLYRYRVGPSMNCSTDTYKRLSRFTRNETTGQFGNEYILIQQSDPHCWHNGGGMFFDTAGFFYCTLGDAGGAYDNYGSTQQIDQFLMGGLIRIDVDNDPSRSHPIRRQPGQKASWLQGSYSQGYMIPNDNPWLDPAGGILEEFYAIGLRSPHRATMDTLTGLVWYGDVGQGTREEIGTIEKGDNLQWPYMEGTLDKDDVGGLSTKPSNLIGVDKPPLYDYPRSEGNCVIGGFVYRGDKFSASLGGLYLFGDHGQRKVWTFNPLTQEVKYLLTVPAGGVGGKNGISSFETDDAGNVYILKLFGTDLDGGIIYKLKQASNVPDPPAQLSNLGAFSNLQALTPVQGFIPFDVNTPLWTDNSAKYRWIGIPNDGTHNTSSEQVVFSEDDPWQFPGGTVIIKQFDAPVDHTTNPVTFKRMETRFLVVKSNGSVYGLTYKWNDQGTDAMLLSTGENTPYTVINESGGTENTVWTFPSRQDCLGCHNANSGYILGVKTSELNGDYDYALRTDNQLNTWHHLGIFSNPFNVNQIPTFLKQVPLDDPLASPEQKVRSYLDINCSHCHRPNGVQGAFDARFKTPLDTQHIVGALGISSNTPLGDQIVKPGDPMHSELWERDNTLSTGAMPPIAKNKIDTNYINVLTDWINSLDCKIDYLSDLQWNGIPTNGWGPVEKDQSNGEQAAGDGDFLTLNGEKYAKGLGVHAVSEVEYNIDPMYSRFRATIGVDDEVSGGSVVFKVFVDNVVQYTSPTMSGSSASEHIDIDVTGASLLKLRVEDGGNGNGADHADWANARFLKACDDGDPCTVNDYFDENCNCTGILIDENGDGICDDYNFDLAINAYLEGPFLNPFAGEETLMRDDLRANDLLPSTSPYGDGATCNPGIFDETGPNAIVDWVWVELRTQTSTNNAVEGRSALLQRDGDIVHTDCVSPVTMGAGAGDYHIVVKHRNHLAIMSAQKITVSTSSVTQVNFTDGTVVLHGTNGATLMSGKVALWAGDAEVTGVIDSGDQSEAWNKRNSTSYLTSDLNLDGLTDAEDRGIPWNNQNLVSQVQY